jgi:hypothetical protein
MESEGHKLYFRFNKHTSIAEVEDGPGNVLVWSVELPIEFVRSESNKRTIEPISVVNILNGAMNEDYFFCSDFVENGDYLDCQVCPTNRWWGSRIIYPVSEQHRRIRFWFSDVSGVRRNVSEFSVCLLLTY